MKATSIPQVLIPAAGFGKRAGSPEAKELLPDPKTGRPLIEHSLSLAHERGWKSVVITRKDKSELLEYLIGAKKLFPLLEVQQIDSSNEWPDTLAQSENYWCEENIVILPDTRFGPDSSIDDLILKLQSGSDLAFATFEISEPKEESAWGMIQEEDRTWSICEKPKIPKKNQVPWGLFAFRKKIGRGLFQKLSESSRTHQWQSLGSDISIVNLDFFEDLTRLI